MIVMPSDGVLREHLIQATAWVAEQMRRCKTVPETFTLTMKLEASTEKSEVTLTYVLDHRRNYDNAVEGNSLAEVTFELLRRTGWKATHKPLQLTWNGAGAPSLEESE